VIRGNDPIDAYRLKMAMAKQRRTTENKEEVFNGKLSLEM